MAYPSNDSVFQQPLGSSGSLGLVPRLHRYYELLRLPAAHPASLRFLRVGGTTLCQMFAPFGGGTPLRAWVRFTWLPSPLRCRRKRQGLPGSWGTPREHALLYDPGGTH